MPAMASLSILPSFCLLAAGMLISLCLPHIVLSSTGDRSIPFQNFLRTCLIANCSSDAKLLEFEIKQPMYMQLLGWHCQAECKYLSMWNTVDHFQHHSKRPVPQFNGKWPFVRVFGIQEPASVVFSIMNGLSNVYMLWRMRQSLPKHAPMYNVWQGYGMVAIIAWICSTIFHTRDLLWTEYIDYFAAFALTVTGLWTAWIRIFAVQGGHVSIKRALPITAALLFSYIRHVYFLTTVKFDYGYNMAANIAVAVFISVSWVVWSLYRIRTQPYLWKTIATVVIGNLLVLLELGDFPPILWTFDAHSLWHAGTSPIPLLFFSFAIDDSRYLLQISPPELKKGV